MENTDKDTPPKKFRYQKEGLFKIINKHGEKCEYCQRRKLILIEKAAECGFQYDIE